MYRINFCILWYDHPVVFEYDHPVVFMTLYGMTLIIDIG